MVEAFAAAMLGACVEEVTVMKEEPLFLLRRLVFFRSQELPPFCLSVRYSH